MSSICFTVRYGGSKTEGYLIVDLTMSWAFLKNKLRKTVAKAQIPLSVLHKLKEGSCICLSVSDIRIEVLQRMTQASTKPFCESEPPKKIARQSSTLNVVPKSSSQIVSSSSSPSALEESQRARLRSHQREAVNFLFERFNDTGKRSEKQPIVMGAVLADDMGMGKTLTSLTVTYQLSLIDCLARGRPVQIVHGDLGCPLFSSRIVGRSHRHKHMI